MDKHKIQHALDTVLSGLQDDPFLAQRVMTQAKGRKKMKKKVSAGLTFAVILILVAVTAFAVGLASYFSRFAALENTYGDYEQ